MAASTTIREGTLDDAEALQRLVASVIAERLPVLIRREQVFTVEEELDFVRRLIESPN